MLCGKELKHVQFLLRSVDHLGYDVHLWQYVSCFCLCGTERRSQGSGARYRNRIEKRPNQLTLELTTRPNCVRLTGMLRACVCLSLSLSHTLGCVSLLRVGCAVEHGRECVLRRVTRVHVCWFMLCVLMSVISSWYMLSRVVR